LAQRDKVWRASFEMARLNPIFGIGGGNWKQINIDQLKSSVESRGETFNAEDFALQWGHPHNIYLSNLVDRGVLGLITFLSFMAIWLITLIKSYKKLIKIQRRCSLSWAHFQRGPPFLASVL
jgi:O-antigen ligase